jgi:hypothetical protein
MPGGRHRLETARLSDKDREFAEAYHAARPLNHDLIIERIKATKLSRRSKGRR